MFKVTGTLSYFQLVHTREFFSWGGGGGGGGRRSFLLLLFLLE